MSVLIKSLMTIEEPGYYEVVTDEQGYPYVGPKAGYAEEIETHYPVGSEASESFVNLVNDCSIDAKTGRIPQVIQIAGKDKGEVDAAAELAIDVLRDREMCIFSFDSIARFVEMIAYFKQVNAPAVGVYVDVDAMRDELEGWSEGLLVSAIYSMVKTSQQNNIGIVLIYKERELSLSKVLLPGFMAAFGMGETVGSSIEKEMRVAVIDTEEVFERDIDNYANRVGAAGKQWAIKIADRALSCDERFLTDRKTNANTLKGVIRSLALNGDNCSSTEDIKTINRYVKTGLRMLESVSLTENSITAFRDLKAVIDDDLNVVLTGSMVTHHDEISEINGKDAFHLSIPLYASENEYQQLERCSHQTVGLNGKPWNFRISIERNGPNFIWTPDELDVEIGRLGNDRPAVWTKRIHENV